MPLNNDNHHHRSSRHRTHHSQSNHARSHSHSHSHRHKSHSHSNHSHSHKRNSHSRRHTNTQRHSNSHHRHSHSSNNGRNYGTNTYDEYHSNNNGNNGNANDYNTYNDRVSMHAQNYNKYDAFDEENDNYAWRRKQRESNHYYSHDSPPNKKRKINASEKRYKLVEFGDRATNEFLTPNPRWREDREDIDTSQPSYAQIAGYKPPKYSHTNIENALRNNRSNNNDFGGVDMSDEKRRQRMQRFGTVVPMHNNDDYGMSNNNNDYRRNNNRRNYNRNRNRNRSRTHSRNRRYNNRRADTAAQNTNLRMSPQYDTDGKQMMSLTTYTVRNERHFEMAKQERIAKQRRKEQRKVQKWHERQMQKRMAKMAKANKSVIETSVSDKEEIMENINETSSNESEMRLSQISSVSSSTNDENEEINADNTKYECDLTEKPLILVCNNSNTDSKWNIVLNDINRRCFGGYLANPFSKDELSEWFALLTAADNGMEWIRPRLNNGRLLPRKAAWLVSAQCKCHYRYSNTKWKPIPFPHWFESLTQRVMSETGLSYENMPNSCNVNWYEHGLDSVGWHTDDEPLFQSKFDDCLIVSLSLGQSRKFEIKLSEIIGNELCDIKQIILHSGDLMTMEGLFQKYYLHRVPKSYTVSQPRINLTWRWIKRHYLHRDQCYLSTADGRGKVTVNVCPSKESSSKE